MTSAAPDRLDAVAPTSNGPTQRPPTHADDPRSAETSNMNHGGGFAVPPLPSSQAETRANTDEKGQGQPILSTDERFSQSDPRSAEGSQASNATSTSDQVFTPTASDASNNQGSQGSQLHALSALAAAQDRMMTDDGAASRKRMADGEVKSPVKGHSRNTSTISMASTTSTIGELSSELRTRLSYAMVKVNNGWQAHSLDEVESFSQAVSPTSSTGTAHRRNGSSASPQLTGRPQVHFANDSAPRRNSNSPPTLANRPTLAPPATIRPTIGMPHPRRNSNPHYTPTLLSHSHSASPRTPALNTNLGGSQRPEQALYSPHQNVREQDAIESLLFMSSPNHSANLKHSFSPAGSPGLSGQPTPRSSGVGRQPLPGGPSYRKALPTGRPGGGPVKRPGFDAPSGMAPDSPMDVDSPYSSPRGMPRRRTDAGGGTHLRSALSLPSALGLSSHVSQRKPMSDRDIDQMLNERDESNNSSDDEEIALPPRRTGFAGTVGV